MADQDEVMFMLGEIKGQLTGMNKRLDKVDKMDERLRKTEIKAAKNGAVAGGVVGVGLAIIIAGAKEIFKSHGT